MNASKRATRTDWIDPDDAPELTDEFFDAADKFEGNKLVRRGRPTGSHKTPTTIRFDDDIIAAFKATGPRWQSRLNAAVRDWLKTHSPDDVGI